MIDSDRHPILKSASTDVIISNKSQILRSMADLLLSNQRPFQNEDLCVLLPCHIMNVGQVCTSCALYITSNECKTAKLQA